MNNSNQTIYVFYWKLAEIEKKMVMKVLVAKGTTMMQRAIMLVLIECSIFTFGPPSVSWEFIKRSADSVVALHRR